MEFHNKFKKEQEISPAVPFSPLKPLKGACATEATCPSRAKSSRRRGMSLQGSVHFTFTGSLAFGKDATTAVPGGRRLALVGNFAESKPPRRIGVANLWS